MHTHTPNTSPPPAPENADNLWKRCRHCGKRFRAAKSYFICCSWQCTEAHKAELAALDALDAEYAGDPF